MTAEGGPEDSDAAARQRGEAAGRDRQPLGANPYRMGTHQRSSWEDGWREGERRAPQGAGPPG